MLAPCRAHHERRLRLTIYSLDTMYICQAWLTRGAYKIRVCPISIYLTLFIVHMHSSHLARTKEGFALRSIHLIIFISRRSSHVEYTEQERAPSIIVHILLSIHLLHGQMFIDDNIKVTVMHKPALPSTSIHSILPIYGEQNVEIPQARAGV